MSHFEKLIALKEEMIEANVPAEHMDAIVQEAYFRAALHHLFNKPKQLIDVTQEDSDELWKQFDMWNGVTPVSGGVIIERIKLFVTTLKMNLIRAEDFKVEFSYCHSDCGFVTGESTAFKEFKNVLVKEFRDCHA